MALINVLMTLFALIAYTLILYGFKSNTKILLNSDLIILEKIDFEIKFEFRNSKTNVESVNHFLKQGETEKPYE